VKYASVLGTDAFTVAFVPGELDAQKVNHRNPDVREQAKKMSDRIKGWRTRGISRWCVRSGKCLGSV